MLACNRNILSIARYGRHAHSRLLGAGNWRRFSTYGSRPLKTSSNWKWPGFSATGHPSPVKIWQTKKEVVIYLENACAMSHGCKPANMTCIVDCRILANTSSKSVLAATPCARSRQMETAASWDIAKGWMRDILLESSICTQELSIFGCN